MTIGRNSHFDSPNPTEPTARRLREKLYMARETIIRLMGPEISDILTSYFHCSSEEETRMWRYVTAARIVACTHSRPPAEMGDYGSSTPRSVCPLCGGSAVNPFGICGFAVPVGLKRHLLGSHNSDQCSIFEAADALAREYRHRKYPGQPNPVYG